MGHGTCTCEGAAFEYVFNVDHELREAGVRDLARVVYLTNEAALGDFGVDGMVFDQQGFQTTSELWTGSLFRERGVEAILGAHVSKVEEGLIHYETLDGTTHTLEFDFAMLIPPFGGVPLKAYDADGADITAEIFAPQRLHEGGRRLHRQALRGVAGHRLADHLRRPRLRQPVGRRDRVRPAAPDLAAAQDRQRHADRTLAAAHRACRPA